MRWWIWRTVGSQGVAGDSVHPHEAPVDFHKLYAEMEFYDDVKGGPLDRDEVIKARRLEMDYFKNMGCIRRSRERRPDGSGPK